MTFVTGEHSTRWVRSVADDLRSALAQIEDVLGDLEQLVEAAAGDEAWPPGRMAPRRRRDDSTRR